MAKAVSIKESEREKEIEREEERNTKLEGKGEGERLETPRRSSRRILQNEDVLVSGGR